MKIQIKINILEEFEVDENDFPNENIFKLFQESGLENQKTYVINNMLPDINFQDIEIQIIE